MWAEFHTRCLECGRTIRPGNWIVYSREHSRYVHETCLTRQKGATVHDDDNCETIESAERQLRAAKKKLRQARRTEKDARERRREQKRARKLRDGARRDGIAALRAVASNEGAPEDARVRAATALLDV